MTKAQSGMLEGELGLDCLWTRNLLFLALVLIGSLNEASGQEKWKRQIGVGSGWCHDAINDGIVSSFTQGGSGLPFQFFIRSMKKRTRLHSQFFYVSPSLVSASAGVKVVETRAYAQYAGHQQVGPGNSIRIYAGAVLDLSGSARQITTTISLGTISRVEKIFSLSPSMILEKSLGKDIISLQTWVALIAYSVQPGYSNSYPQEANWQGIGSFVKIDTRLSYNRYFSERWDGRLDYQFRYCRQDLYETQSQVSQEVVFSLVYKLR